MQLSGGRFCAPGSGRPAPSFLGGRPPLPSPWSCGRRGGCSAPSRCHAAPYGGSVAPLPPVFIGSAPVRSGLGVAWWVALGGAAASCKAAAAAARLLLLQGCCKRTGRNQRQLIRKASAARARQSKAARCTQLQGAVVGGLTPLRPKPERPRKQLSPPNLGATPSPPG